MQFQLSQLSLLSVMVCLIAPPVLLCLKHPRLQRAVSILYVLGILYFTVGDRLIAIAFGTRAFDTVRQLNFSLFWSYAKFDQADIRWQVYMNVFLFIPFGFMLPWCSSKLQRFWKVLLIAAALSALTEAAQYFLRIGLCETDDVIHNTLGAVIGYGYWRLLCRVQTHFRGDRK